MNPSITDRTDLHPAEHHLELAAALIAQEFCDRRGHTEAPHAYHQYLQAELYDRLHEAVLDRAVETPEDWEREERLDAAVERGRC